VANQTTLGSLRRNSFYGPYVADTDTMLAKRIVKAEGINFTIGTQATTCLAVPTSAIRNAAVTQVGTSSFGLISSTQAPQGSPYGSFENAGVSQRVLVITGKITF
jgi:hypothetical protein